MRTNKYKDKAGLLKLKYGPIIEEFGFISHNDDRLLVVSTLNQIVEACEAMEDVDNAFIRVAFDRLVEEEDKTMEAIVTRFVGREYKNGRWKDKDPADDIHGTITKEMIQKGLALKTIKVVADPLAGDDIACVIGGCWFYFGGSEAEGKTPEEFLRDTPIEDVVREIYDTLNDFRRNPDFSDEYKYYVAFLQEALEK